MQASRLIYAKTTVIEPALKTRAVLGFLALLFGSHSASACGEKCQPCINFLSAVATLRTLRQFDVHGLRQHDSD